MMTIMKIIQLLGSVLLWHGLCPLHQEAENREFWNANRHCTTTEDTPEKKWPILHNEKRDFQLQLFITMQFLLQYSDSQVLK